MTTYKIGAVKEAGARFHDVRRLLVCEQCLTALGDVWTVAEYSGLPASLISKMWPEMAEQACRHATECPVGTIGRTRDQP